MEQQHTQLTVNRFLHELKKYSLVTDESTTNNVQTFSVHQSTREIAHAYITERLHLTPQHPLMQTVSNTLEHYTQSVLDQEDLAQISFLKNHCKQFMTSSLLNESTKGAIGALVGAMDVKKGTIADSVKNSFEESLVHLKKDYSKNALKIANALAYLGELHREFGRYAEAKEVLEESLALYKKNVSGPSLNMSRTLMYLGNIYRLTGDYENAGKLFSQTKKTFTKLGHDALAAQSAIYLAANDIELGYYSQASSGLRATLQLLKKNNQHPFLISRCLEFLGFLYIQMGLYPDASSCLEEGFKLAQKLWPQDHCFVGVFLCYLGMLEVKQKHYGKAEDHLKKCIDIYEKKNIKNYAYFYALRSLGSSYREQGQYEKARKLLEKSYGLRKAVYKEDNVHTARNLRSLGELYIKMEDYETAKIFIQRALDILQKHAHPIAYSCYEDLSTLYEVLANKNPQNESEATQLKKQALACLKQAHAIAQAAFPKNSAHIIRIETKLLQMRSKK